MRPASAVGFGSVVVVAGLLAPACGGQSEGGDGGGAGGSGATAGNSGAATTGGTAGEVATGGVGGVPATGGAAPVPLNCPDRIRPVACNAEPPACDDGYFPGSDAGCWTGECLHCIDGCETDADCVAIKSCGCWYHEGCSWGESVYRHALGTDRCLVPVNDGCPGGCPDNACPELCDWCDVDYAMCQGGTCVGITDHMCM